MLYFFWLWEIWNNHHCLKLHAQNFTQHQLNPGFRIHFTYTQAKQSYLFHLCNIAFSICAPSFCSLQPKHWSPCDHVLRIWWQQWHFVWHTNPNCPQNSTPFLFHLPSHPHPTETSLAPSQILNKDWFQNYFFLQTLSALTFLLLSSEFYIPEHKYCTFMAIRIHIQTWFDTGLPSCSPSVQPPSSHCFAFDMCISLLCSMSAD